MKALSGLPENGPHSFPPKTNTLSSCCLMPWKTAYSALAIPGLPEGETVTVTSGILSGMPIDISCTCYKNRYE